uniref:Homeobox protein SIX1 N-terminal SD domain-containing protein n=1 Tax=Podarcis muralis TaxID=64176 RepID=A0A670I980_PODMU
KERRVGEKEKERGKEGGKRSGKEGDRGGGEASGELLRSLGSRGGGRASPEAEASPGWEPRRGPGAVGGPRLLGCGKETAAQGEETRTARAARRGRGAGRRRARGPRSRAPRTRPPSPRAPPSPPAGEGGAPPAAGGEQRQEEEDEGTAEEARQLLPTSAPAPSPQAPPGREPEDGGGAGGGGSGLATAAASSPSAGLASAAPDPPRSPRFSAEQVSCGCEALLQAGDPGWLGRFLGSLPPDAEAPCLEAQAGESLAKARALLAFQRGDFAELYRLVQSRRWDVGGSSLAAPRVPMWGTLQPRDVSATQAARQADGESPSAGRPLLAAAAPPLAARLARLPPTAHQATSRGILVCRGTPVGKHWSKEQNILHSTHPLTHQD